MKPILLLALALAAPSTLLAQNGHDNAEARVQPAQVQRGEAVFKNVCSACHTTSQFSGSEFARSWGGRPIFEFYDQIRVSMPQDGPGRLSAKEYLDIVVYLMKLNGHAPGETEIPLDEGVLKGIRFRRT